MNNAQPEGLSSGRKDSLMTLTKYTNLDSIKGASDQSFYTIAGCGGDINDWVSGYEELMKEKGIGAPSEWVTFNGSLVNQLASDGGAFEIAENDKFDPSLTFLAFPLDGLNVGKLAIFKLAMQDRWLDDIISNMRRDYDQ